LGMGMHRMNPEFSALNPSHSPLPADILLREEPEDEEEEEEKDNDEEDDDDGDEGYSE